jgi:acylphosphatase
MPKAENSRAEVTRRYTVTGRVQGVGFRWFVEREAKLLAVRGWVRNRHDGAVEVLAAGTEEQLGRLYTKLRTGPPAARVDDVDVQDAPDYTESNTFQIEGAW